jgi:hypothetical protein
MIKYDKYLMRRSGLGLGHGTGCRLSGRRGLGGGLGGRRGSRGSLRCRHGLGGTDSRGGGLGGALGSRGGGGDTLTNNLFGGFHGTAALSRDGFTLSSTSSGNSAGHLYIYVTKK